MTTLIADTNVCLKGYAQSADASPEPPPSPDPAPTAPALPSVRLSDAAAKPRATARIAYRITQSGVTSGSAAVTLSLRTSCGVVVRSRTLQGVSLASPHVWRLRSPLKRGAYRIVAVAADDTGHVSKAATATLRVR